MSKVTTKQVILLVSRAARDEALRDRFIESPEAAARALNIELDEADAKKLKRISADLKRFGGNPKLKSTDAKYWALGIISHVTENDDPWSAIKSRQRTAVKNWEPGIAHVTENEPKKKPRRG
jgi:hypothetical protein